MSDRHVFLLCYDVSDARRLRRVHRLMKGFGTWLQFSIFRCELTPLELVQMQERLFDEIHHREDQVMVVDLGPLDGRGDRVIQFWGRSGPQIQRGPIIV